MRLSCCEKRANRFYRTRRKKPYKSGPANRLNARSPHGIADLVAIFAKLLCDLSSCQYQHFGRSKYIIDLDIPAGDIVTLKRGDLT